MAQQEETRRLAAIFSADVVGYSRLMGADESGTLATLRTHRSELIDPTIEQHHGRIFKTMGDGLLVEFPSVVEAVACAVEMQEGMARRNGDADEATRMLFRVGINVGDVIIEGDDVYGDGVNIAARIESLAEPGGIYISRSARDQVRDKLPLTLDDMGEQEVKNIARPVRVFRVRLSGDAAPARLAPAPKAPEVPDKPSIAVLPFDNMTRDPEQEYFVDGIVEDIITGLSQLRWLTVIARNTTFTFKGQAVDVKKVAQDLGVRYVLEGSVRKGGNRLRITAQLIDGTSGDHVWAQRYDRELEDIFDLQDEITETIIAAIEPELGEAERARARRKPTENLDAWECCQRGLWHMYRYNHQDNAEAQRLFAQASELDANFGAAYAGSAYASYLDVLMGYTDAPAETLVRALEAGQRAVAQDDRDPVAHFALGRVYTIKGQHDAAIAELKKAIDLNPSYAQAHYGLGFALALSGRLEEALPPIDRAIALSPHDPILWTFMSIRALALIALQRYDEAAEWARKAQRQPNVEFWAPALLASALGHLGLTDEARACIDEARRMKPDLSTAFIDQTLPFDRPADRERLLEGLRKAGMEN